MTIPDWVLWLLLAFWVLRAARLALSMYCIDAKVPCFNGFRVIIPDGFKDQVSWLELRAIMAHEEGHQHHGHVWVNFLLYACFITPPRALRRWQEFQADDYAIAHGHGFSLACSLSKRSIAPSDRERVARIEWKLAQQRMSEGVGDGA